MPPAYASEIISPIPGLMSYNGGDMILHLTPAMILYVQWLTSASTIAPAFFLNSSTICAVVIHSTHSCELIINIG